MMEPAIRIVDLVKEFGTVRAVDCLSFTINQGEIYGFLGQNGAGKSTTIRMLLSLVHPTSGHIELLGMDLKKHRREILSQVGAVIESPGSYGYLTGLENLSLFARLSGRNPVQSRLRQYLDLVGLWERARDKVSTYSQGMKQRLAIAIAMVNDPKIIILDEPTNGLDPQGIADMRNLILRLGRDLRKTVLISSHLLSEVELIADRILIIDRGKKIVEGSVKDLFNPDLMVLELRVLNPEIVSGAIAGLVWKSRLHQSAGDVFQFHIREEEIPDLTRDLAGAGARIFSVRPMHSLEQYFLSLTSADRHVEPIAD